ncbi:MAG: glycosyltransferase family 4 protein [Lachnospiraceae bacterium]
MRFTAIGYIERRKGQDILVDALEGISAKALAGSEFLLVGQDHSVMAQSLRERIWEMPWVRMTGTVSRQKIHRILDFADVLICPSREDPMPTVCAEAMMHHVPCLLSDTVGTAAYISDGMNGIVFKNGDVNGLREKIIWCIKNRETVKKMGNEAYKVYENIFSVKAFEKNLLTYVGEMTGIQGTDKCGI